MKFGIKHRRKALGMSQVALSEKSGISRATISAIEQGKADNVLISTLVALANAMDTTVDKLFCGERQND